ncbi:hypothetical protein O7626_38055 [Micromonospora sp. WMMD1102]|uniref:hypothetical protein n=1 Tax=Micromonospora sp. WMMD1102 TaxID=3016105 RepID=UPI002414E6C5|nr:hypothetical protein [Micromonospora sp. WMMD1102]MDG4791636.1 hypothetical protein [Micromonospora sp. WMMD1102]
MTETDPRLSTAVHHLERSTAPGELVVRTFTGAAEHYLAVGFYEAALHTARVADRHAEPEDVGTSRTLRVIAFWGSCWSLQ